MQDIDAIRATLINIINLINRAEMKPLSPNSAPTFKKLLDSAVSSLKAEATNPEILSQNNWPKILAALRCLRVQALETGATLDLWITILGYETCQLGALISATIEAGQKQHQQEVEADAPDGPSAWGIVVEEIEQRVAALSSEVSQFIDSGQATVLLPQVYQLVYVPFSRLQELCTLQEVV